MTKDRLGKLSAAGQWRSHNALRPAGGRQAKTRELISIRNRPRRGCNDRRRLRGGLDASRVHLSAAELDEYLKGQLAQWEQMCDETLIRLLAKYRGYLIDIFNVDRLRMPFVLQKQCTGVFLHRLIFGTSNLPGPNMLTEPLGTDHVFYLTPSIRNPPPVRGDDIKSIRQHLIHLMPEVEVYFSSNEKLSSATLIAGGRGATLQIYHENGSKTNLWESRSTSVQIDWNDLAWWNIEKIHLFDEESNIAGPPNQVFRRFRIEQPTYIAMTRNSVSRRMDSEYCVFVNCWKEAGQQKPAREADKVFRIFVRWPCS